MKIGSLEDTLECAERVVNRIVNGECSRCGNCCGNFLPVSAKEVKVIKRYVKKKHIKAQDHNYPLNASLDWTCPFRDDAKKICTIYEVRPAICRAFRCDMSPKDMQANKELFSRKFFVCNMRKEFFGKGGDLMDLIAMGVISNGQNKS